MNNKVPAFASSPITAPQWRQIVDSATETAIITFDLHGRVTAWSDGSERLLGWSESEMLGEELNRIFLPGSQQLSVEMAEARTKDRGFGEEGWRLRKDGTRIWAVGEVSPIRENDQIVGFVKILRDRTQQRTDEEAVREERRALEILNRVGSALAIETELHQLVQIVTDAGVELTGAELGAFFYNVRNESGESYMLYTLSGASPEAFSKFPMPPNTAVFAPTFNGKGIVRSEDITKDPRYGKNAPHKGHAGRSSASAKLSRGSCRVTRRKCARWFVLWTRPSRDFHRAFRARSRRTGRRGSCGDG